MERRERVVVRLVYDAPNLNVESEELKGFLDNLMIPLAAAIRNYIHRADVVLRFSRAESGIRAVIEVELSTEFEVLPNLIKNSVAALIEDTFGFAPDRIEIVYESE